MGKGSNVQKAQQARERNQKKMGKTDEGMFGFLLACFTVHSVSSVGPEEYKSSLIPFFFHVLYRTRSVVMRFWEKNCTRRAEGCQRQGREGRLCEAVHRVPTDVHGQRTCPSLVSTRRC